jgi:hypothetical protein
MKNVHFILDIHLKNVSSPLVRRVISVPQNITLIKLGKVINEAMGWYSYHLHMFKFDDDHYGEVFDFDDGNTIDHRRKHLQKVLGNRKQFTYIYDFGDHWEHQIFVKTSTQLPPHPYFMILAEGACPPEDCGGAPGYEELKYVIADPENEDYDEMTEWCGDDFDPNLVDISLIQDRLNSIK